jgi:4-amino-4-deoxy-L-arabinose transferase-like glycosyltransferase
MSTKRRAQATVAAAAPQVNVRLEREGTFIGRHSLVIFLVLVALATARIVSTYTVFNHTSDEPAHIACGMEWLDQGTYLYEAQHPPLARVMTAILPHYVLKAHSQNQLEMYREGLAILYTGHRYDLTLALARLGILPFYWLACWAVYWWARRSFGDLTAVFATLCFTFLPPALAHGGLATTDMALTATFGASFVMMLSWLELPSWGRSGLLGLTLGAAVLSKFSVFVFFPAVMAFVLLGYLVFERPRLGHVVELARARFKPLALAAAIACLIIWAGYRFAFHGVPAPPLWEGIQQVMDHNSAGHPAYLLGSRSLSGWWYFFEVALAVKTPLALLGLIGVGSVLCWKRRRDLSAYWIPLAFIAGILVVGALSHINIGVRHVLPVYLAFSVVAGVGAKWLWEMGGKAHWILGGLALWMMASSGFSHPDYLAYFNELAGHHPENILVDSDLDWGQDMKRLGTRLREVGAPEVSFYSFFLARLESQHGFPPIKPSNPQRPSPGWNAVSLTMLKKDRMGLGEDYPEIKPWPERVPEQQRVGKSVLLYYFPPGTPGLSPP